MNQAEKIYRELAINPITSVVEAIGDNKIDNMVQELGRVTEVELGMFVATMLQKTVSLFAYDYEAPKYDGFEKAFKDIKERYQVMSGEEQGDLFTKIEQMFKEIFVQKFSGLGPEEAEATAKLYANQMIGILKDNSIQKNTEMYPQIKSIY